MDFPNQKSHGCEMGHLWCLGVAIQSLEKVTFWLSLYLLHKLEITLAKQNLKVQQKKQWPSYKYIVSD